MRLDSPRPEVIAAVMANMRPNRDDKGKKVRRCLSKGLADRRILAKATLNGVEHSYHATKGWRRTWVGV